MANEYANYDLEIAPGATYTRTITWTVSDALVNLAGYTATLTISEQDGTQLLQLTSGAGITLGGVAGTIAITISDTQSSTITADGTYQLDLESGGGIVTRLLHGAVRRVTV